MEDQSHHLDPVGVSFLLPKIGVFWGDGLKERDHEKGQEDRF